MRSDLQAAQLLVIEAVDELAVGFGTTAWLRGGWAVDFCLGRVTRPHTDVDIYTEPEGHRRIVDALVADGWDLDNWLPVDRQADLSRGAVELSLNPVYRLNGLPVYGPGPWEGVPHPPDMLEHAGRARVGGVEASYISPMAQIELKLMTRVWRPEFPFREKDEIDVALLCRYMLHLGRNDSDPVASSDG